MTDYSRNKSNRAASLVYSDEINDKLLKLMNETGYSIEQVNGQRIFSSPRQDIIPPSRGCEVFVGKIPRDCYEDELFPVLTRAGRVHELRLMMLFSGTNRGYAFVMYERPEDARRAVDLLDGFEIRRGHRIGVLPCQNNCRLFVGCFGPGDRSPAQLEQILRSETEGVAGVWKKSATTSRGRWYLLVEYISHRAAAVARRHLTPRRDSLFGSRVIVDWEVPMERRGRTSRSSSLLCPRRIHSEYPAATPLPMDPLPILHTPSSLLSSKLRRANSDMDEIGHRKSCVNGLTRQQTIMMNGVNNAMASSLNWLTAPGTEPSSPIDMVTMLRRRESAQQRRQWPPQPQQPTPRQTFRGPGPGPGPAYPNSFQQLLSPDSGLFSDQEVNNQASSPGSSGSGSSLNESPWSSGDRYTSNYTPSPPSRSSLLRPRHLWDPNSSDFISELEGFCVNQTSSLVSSESSPPDRLGGRRFLLGNGDMHWIENNAGRCSSPLRSSFF